jgi:hypothetical protein
MEVVAAELRAKSGGIFHLEGTVLFEVMIIRDHVGSFLPRRWWGEVGQDSDKQEWQNELANWESHDVSCK